MNDSITHPTHADIFGTTTNPCPSWCDQPVGHGYESEDFDGTRFRVHSKDLSPTDLTRFPGSRPFDASVAIIVGEEFSVDGVVTIQGPPRLSLDVSDAEVDAQTARDLAAAILSAADALDALER